MANIKNPPIFLEDSSYESWEKSVKLWQLVTNLKAEQQGPALVLALTGKAKDIVLELEIDVLKSAQGVKTILEKLQEI